MKKLFLILTMLVFSLCSAETLKGGVSQDYIPKGFFGSWGVISKLNSTDNPRVFNYESRDIWTLSGYSNILILENLESGATSQITVKDKSLDGKTLKFERKKTGKDKGQKVIYREIVEFSLLGNNFSGTDKFIIERYNENNELLRKDNALYRIEGVKISGS